MVLIVLGPPGAGKGTQCQILSQKLRVPHISTGDILRDQIRRATRLGRRVKETIEDGGLVADELVMNLLLARIDESDCARGFILDGFPRTREQASLLDLSLSTQERAKQSMGRLVVRLVVSQRCLVRRLAGRQVCPSCQTVYGAHFHRPQVPDYCDKDASFLAMREDDHEETIVERLRNFDEKIFPIVAHYATHDCVLEIDGDRPPDEVTAAILQALPEGWRAVIS
jgi:adenylate kinase